MLKEDSINGCDHQLNNKNEEEAGTKDDLVVVSEWRMRCLRNRLFGLKEFKVE